jgi:hypothetical protein
MLIKLIQTDLKDLKHTKTSFLKHLIIYSKIIIVTALH